MLQNYLPFYEIAGEVQRLLRIATLYKKSEYSRASKVSDEEAQEYRNLLAAIQKACKEHGFSHTAEMAKRAAQREATTYDDVHYNLIALNDSLTNELAREAIFRVPPERTAYYERDDLFGPEVAAAFPSCARDIRKAGSCYALGQEDGCVHHLMMVLERGLNALAGSVGVPYQRANWQVVINAVGAKLKAPGVSAAERIFFGEVNAQFGFLKVAYRNHSEHVRDDQYDMEKALHIFNHVRAFMQELTQGGLTESH